MTQTTDGYRCQACGFTGVLYDCHPVKDDDGPAEPAQPEDPVCANHPTKKAVAICSGTGDYICSLCRVNIYGKDYSVQYLDGDGKGLAAEAFAQFLPRPDRSVIIMLVLSFLVTGIAPICLVFSTMYLRRAFRLRKENELYGKIMSPVAPVLCWVLNIVLALVTLLLIGFLVYHVLTLNPGAFPPTGEY